MMEDQDVNFANVEFELEAHENLDGLINSLGEEISISFRDELENGTHFLSFSLRETYDTPDAAIAALCSLVEELSPRVRSIWDNCEARRFDIGFESGNTEVGKCTKIEHDTIKRVSDIGGCIVITIYPISESWKLVRS